MLAFVMLKKLQEGSAVPSAVLRAPRTKAALSPPPPDTIHAPSPTQGHSHAGWGGQTAYLHTLEREHTHTHTHTVKPLKTNCDKGLY